MLGNEFWKPVGPFNHRDAVAEEVIVESESRDRWPVFQAKEIEMINGQPPAWIFVHNRKRWAVHGSATAQASYKTPGK